ncbi:MAG: DUF4097 family beta strand repeat protein [Ignavibacteriae bacterium]|nr:DUF4097 family beta strand repeat protein [Ignavibacteriota bacterium]
MNLPLKQIVVALALIAGANTSAAASKEIDQHFKVDAGQKIVIEGFSGSRIRFSSWNKPEVYVHLTVSISASDEKYEQQFIDAVKIEERRSADAVVIRFDDAGNTIKQTRSLWEGVKSLFGMRSVSREVHGEIFVPVGNDLTANIPYANVSLENMNGNIRITGSSNELTLRNCTSLEMIANDYGKTLIQNSGGNLTLTGQSGTISVENFDGAISCNAPYGKLRFSHIRKPLKVRSQSGEITIDDVQGNLNVASDYSPISIMNVAGFAEVQSQSGTITIRQVDGASVKSDYSKIELANVTGKANREIVIGNQSGSIAVADVVGNLRIDGAYSRITMNDVKGNVRVTSQSGSVAGENIDGDWDSETQYSSVRVSRLNAKQVRASNSSDPVKFDLTSVPNSISIRNQYADVAINMPRGFSGEVNLDVEYGTIASNLPINVKNKSNSAYAVGKVGSGSGLISIETTSGKISLMEK